MNANEAKIEALRKRYISMWREGHPVSILKKQTRKDFARMGITGEDPDGFVEWTIYEFVRHFYISTPPRVSQLNSYGTSCRPVVDGGLAGCHNCGS